VCDLQTNFGQKGHGYEIRHEMCYNFRTESCTVLTLGESVGNITCHKD